MTSLTAGSTSVGIYPNEDSMARAAAQTAIDAALDAVTNGRSVAFWFMAAPSAFQFYKSFHEIVRENPKAAAMTSGASFFQFDDYPISRTSVQFPVTFRSLLEREFFEPLSAVLTEMPRRYFLELTGDGISDYALMADYRNHLVSVLDDPDTTVIEVKGIGMDGHWAFHGSETPLTAPADIIWVPMGEANKRQQMIDWPQYFKKPEDIPDYAVTCTVNLLLWADVIIDVVPQGEKEYAVLACYGDNEVHQPIASSAVKRHPSSRSFLTVNAARALVELREGRKSNPNATLTSTTVSRLKEIWTDRSDPQSSARNIRVMLDILSDLRFI